MSPDFLIRFQKGRIAVNCQTEDEANEFLNHLDSEGFRWQSGHNLIAFNNWDKRLENTVYVCEPCKKSILYGSVEFNQNAGKTIVPFSSISVPETVFEIADEAELLSLMGYNNVKTIITSLDE